MGNKKKVTEEIVETVEVPEIEVTEEVETEEVETEEVETEVEAEVTEEVETEVEVTEETEVEVPEVEAEITEEPKEEVTIVNAVVAGCVKLNVRNKPSKDATVVCIIEKDTEVTVNLLHSTEDFYKIHTVKDEVLVEGYCVKEYINII